MTDFEIVEVPKMFGPGRAFQAHCADGRTYHGSAATEDEFSEKVRARLWAEENDEAPDPRWPE